MGFTETMSILIGGMGGNAETALVLYFTRCIVATAIKSHWSCR